MPRTAVRRALPVGFRKTFARLSHGGAPNGDLGLVKTTDAEAGELGVDFDGRDVP